MYPYITIFDAKLYMTGVWIVISFLVFIAVVWYLSKKHLQSFWKFFYWLPLLISLIYFFGSYTQFILSTQSLFPSSITEFLSILSPYWYKFHFAGVLIGILISLIVFFKKIKTVENKKIWIDIFFFAFSLSIVPLWIFLLLWDNFIGNTTEWFLWVKSLHSESQRNKFYAVYPIWLFLSISWLLVALYIHIKRIINKRKRFWLLGIIILLILINIVLIMQQYPRYMVIWAWDLKLDIKQHISFFIIMYCLYLNKKWSAPKLIIEE